LSVGNRAILRQTRACISPNSWPMEDTLESESPREARHDDTSAIVLSWRTIEVVHASADYDEFLSNAEAIQIHKQFRTMLFEPGGQVMWTGVPREWAQKWADERNMQTLSTAMGPLMMKHHPSCLKSTKSSAQWTKYVKGGSRIFALYVPKSHKITVLTRSSPNTFNPEGLSTFQMVEESILKGLDDDDLVSRIDLIHVTVADAKDFRYQIWSKNETHMWDEQENFITLIRYMWNLSANTSTVCYRLTNHHHLDYEYFNMTGSLIGWKKATLCSMKIPCWQCL